MKTLIAMAMAAWVALSVTQPEAHADVFNLPHFVAPGEFALGIEPELVLTSGSGVGINARYTHGLTDLISVSGQIGTGTGPRRFRAGADFDFDLFPDLPGQPGIGLATRAMYVRIPTPGTTTDDVSGQLELSAIPYIHKMFANGGTSIDPFFSLPVGMSFLDGNYKMLMTGVVGSLIQASDNVWFSAEFGIDINHTQSYFAGGVSYFH
jgi:hypothetical protein